MKELKYITKDCTNQRVQSRFTHFPDICLRFFFPWRELVSFAQSSRKKHRKMYGKLLTRLCAI